MKTIHRSSTRGGGDYGWLTTNYSFSFANWHNPTRMGFGQLRVLNDDIVAPKTGFDMHAHADFEIITIVEKGTVTHEDNMGTNAKVSAGEVQVMSAGTGVVHGEFNREDEPLELFQLWISPSQKGVAPRYDQKSFSIDAPLTLLVSEDGTNGSLQIHQSARIFRGNLAAGKSVQHEITQNHGVYLFVIDGTVLAGDVELKKRDALGIEGEESLEIVAKTQSTFLLIEVPM